MGERRPVVVTADDVGLREEWDRETFEAVDRGIVQAVSVVTEGPRFDAALEEIQRRPALQVGVHLNVFDNPANVHLSDVGRFLARRPATSDLTRRWRRQISDAAPLRPVFLNSHYHLHMLPGLFAVTVELAREFGINAIRVTDEPPHHGWHIAPGRLLRTGRTATLWALSLASRRRYPSITRCRGIAASEQLGLAEWKSILSEPGPQPVEIVCHPGQSDAQREALRSNWLREELRQRTVPYSFAS